MQSGIKKITLAGTRMFNYDKSVADAFESCDIIVENIHYRRLPTVFENMKLLRKINLAYDHFSRRRYAKLVMKSVSSGSDVLLLFGRNRLLDENSLRKIKNRTGVYIVFWLIDSVYSTPGWDKMLKLCDLVLCYNADDADLLNSLSVNATFFPLAYDRKYYYPDENTVKDRDVYFAGTISPRIDFLDNLAAKLISRNISFMIDGKLSRMKRFYYILTGKYRFFRMCATGKKRDHRQINTNTNRARICINIQPKQATSALNIRTYELLGAGAFQLTDSTPVLEKLFENSRHIVVYQDIDHLTERIRYFLDNPGERESIARNGFKVAREHHTFECRIKQMIERIVAEKE